MSATERVSAPLAALLSAGVSPWLDEIHRGLIESGELARMIAELSLRGVTTNPSIFHKAILESGDYESELAELRAAGASPQEAYERIALRDVQLAADALAGVHRDANGRDGFVSMEVAPNLAHAAQETLAAARRYWKELSRPNVMIKIPGTPEGVGPIEEAIYEGINLNVTLLFSIEAYERIAEAYLRGLERRQADGLPLDVNSVASFFVSRVDTMVDERLESLGRPDLAGRAGLANARQAYRRFGEIFAGPRWEALRHGGAAVQRPLWASTGVKNPAYPDTLYVDGLVSSHTVNTMPLATLQAAGDHAHLSGPTAEHDPTPDLDALRDAGIDMAAVTDELLVEGVKKFEDAMNDLLKGLGERLGAG